MNARARRLDGIFTPTLANFSLRLIASDPTRFPPTEGSRFLPKLWNKAWNIIAGHPVTEREIELQLAAATALKTYVHEAYERDIPILTGTDTLMPWVVPGEALHLELEAIANAVNSPEKALVSATKVNAAHIAPNTIGLLAFGRRADILLLPSDPRRQLGTLMEWKYVMVNGRLYDRETIDNWLERYRMHFRGGYYETVMGTLINLIAGQFSHTGAENE